MAGSEEPAVPAPRTVGEVPLGEQFANHDGYRPAASSVLSGAALRLFPAGGGASVEVEFAEDSVSWALPEGSTPREGVSAAPYEALELRDGLVAVSARLAERRSLLAVLDLPRGRSIAASTELLEGADGAVRERTEHLQAGIGRPLEDPVRASADLAGKRVLWRYSSTHAIEHVYLNPSCYCWHCVEGPERAMADVDPCVAYRLGEELYLFSWSESVVPFNGAVVVDLRDCTSVGRFFGWDTERRRADQIVVGARGTLLNQTSYPAR